MIAIITYLIGYILSYYTLRYEFRKEEHNYDWKTVEEILLVSILSWIIVIGNPIYKFIRKHPEIFKEPPKWL